ncbi:MAG: hypothetical protein M3Y54_19260 [Bacteroidota bacterium]|nr:hypothetical protein [Bacteroidota bacterium]
MSKLGCECGHIIVDQTEDLPYKADYIPDKLVFSVHEEAIHAIGLFVEAITNNSREMWIANFFDADYAALNLTNEQIISDLSGRFYSAIRRTMYQCENCGRIHIQKRNTNYFSSFLPETDKANNILDA